eukprot:2552086-Prymnesium_polylepis.1
MLRGLQARARARGDALPLPAPRREWHPSRAARDAPTTRPPTVPCWGARVPSAQVERQKIKEAMGFCISKAAASSEI